MTVCLVGCAPTVRKMIPTQAVMSPTEKAYRIQPGDLLEPGNRIVDDRFPTFAAVGQNGRVTLPRIGDIQAAARTLEQFNTDVLEAMRRYLTLANDTMPFLRLTIADKSYVIEPGDLLDFDPAMGDIFGPWVVRKDGMIRLPGYGDVPAAGKTIAQLNADLRQLMTKWIRDDAVIFRSVLKPFPRPTGAPGRPFWHVEH
jgi:protein involved in polysaccharide export with SLBB domain